MWRALVGLGLVCLAAYGAVWLANHPETVSLTWAGREYTTSLAVGVVGFIALALAVSIGLALVRFLLSLPAAIGRRSRARRERKGLASISRGLVAIGAGDVAAGRRYAGEAQRLLGEQPLTLLLSAQAAQASGNREAAEASFRRMTESPDTRVLGLRGLFVEARRRGDDPAAREYAAEAARIAPAAAWASDAVLEAHSADGDWAAATAMIERRASLGLVDKATSRRQRAVLKAADALGREEGDPEGALATALEALKLAPDLVPAAALAGRLLSRKGELRRAARIVETAWSAEPHPDLAAAYLNLRPGDSATDRLRRAETLARLSSWAPEARLAIARAATEARELGRAREALRPLIEERPTVRVCLAMAELESQAGHSGAAREWFARAARAPRDKAWIADGVVSETWAPVSPVTGRLDAFRWDTPPEVIGMSAGPDEPPPSGRDEDCPQPPPGLPAPGDAGPVARRDLGPAPVEAASVPASHPSSSSVQPSQASPNQVRPGETRPDRTRPSEARPSQVAPQQAPEEGSRLRRVELAAAPAAPPPPLELRAPEREVVAPPPAPAPAALTGSAAAGAESQPSPKPSGRASAPRSDLSATPEAERSRSDRQPLRAVEPSPEPAPSPAETGPPRRHRLSPPERSGAPSARTDTGSDSEAVAAPPTRHRLSPPLRRSDVPAEPAEPAPPLPPEAEPPRPARHKLSPPERLSRTGANGGEPPAYSQDAEVHQSLVASPAPRPAGDPETGREEAAGRQRAALA